MKRLKLVISGVTWYVTSVDMSMYNKNVFPAAVQSGDFKGLTQNADLATAFTDAQVATAQMVCPEFVAEAYVAPTPVAHAMDYPLGINGVTGTPQFQDVAIVAGFLNTANDLQADITDLVVTGGIGAALEVKISASAPPVYDTHIVLQGLGFTDYSGTISVKIDATVGAGTYTANLKIATGGAYILTIPILGTFA